MLDIEIKQSSIGKVGFFFNDDNEKTHKIGRLKAVTTNGNCKDEDDCFYDNFTPMTLAGIYEVIDNDFFS